MNLYCHLRYEVSGTWKGKNKTAVCGGFTLEGATELLQGILCNEWMDGGWMNEWKNEWTNERMKEQMNEWTNEWKNEWII
jgi:hypothetical protein